METPMFVGKTNEELEKMSAKRLLSYYNSIRAKVSKVENGIIRDYDDVPEETALYLKQMTGYKARIKVILDTKENV